MKKLVVNNKMSLEEQRTRISVNQAIEKCGDDMNKLKTWLINQIVGLKDEDGVYLIYPNTMSYEQALDYYLEATKC